MLLAVLLAWGGWWFLRMPRYDQDTPQAVLASARQMVLDGRASHLTRLIYADSPQLRQWLDDIGVLLGSLQVLGQEVQRAFPEEVARLRAEAEEAARRGQASTLFRRMGQQVFSARGRSGPPPDDVRQQFDLLMKEVFADPYGWLERSEQRLSVELVDDETAAILWDGKPAFGVGLLMRRHEGRWYISIPFDAPLLRRALPRSADGWEILGSLVATLDNAIRDLTRDVRQGRITRLEELAQRAGEYAFLPAMLAVVAYDRLRESERSAGTP